MRDFLHKVLDGFPNVPNCWQAIEPEKLDGKSDPFTIVRKNFALTQEIKVFAVNEPMCIGTCCPCARESGPPVFASKASSSYLK
jgi:hypothetical protein